MKKWKRDRTNALGINFEKELLVQIFHLIVTNLSTYLNKVKTAFI